MSEQTNSEEKQPTAEELKKMREQQIAFYDQNIPLLNAQVNFEELKARLEKARLDQLQHRLERVHIEVSLTKEQENTPDSESKKED